MNLDVSPALELPSGEAMLDWLQRNGLSPADGLAALLDSASALVGSQPGQARQWAERVRAAAERAALPALVGRANYLCAQTCAINAEFEQALALIESAHRHYVAAGDFLGAQRTNVGRITVLEQLGRYDEAIALAHALQHELDADTSDEALTLIAKSRLNLGVCYLAIGQPERALEAYAQAEALFQHLDDSEGAAQVMNNQGVVLLELGRIDEAMAMFERSVPIFAALDLKLEVAHAHQNIGYAHLLGGRYSAGFAALERARAIVWSLEASADKGALLLDLGDAYLNLNLHAEAEITYREAIDALQSSAAAYEHGRAWQGLGAALHGLGHPREAESALAEAARRFRLAGNDLALSGVVLQQAGLSAATGRRDLALAMADEACRLAQASPLQRAQAHIVFAQLLLPDATAALTHLRLAEAIAEQLRVPRLQQQVLGLLGRVHSLLGEQAIAEGYLLRAIQMIESQRLEIAHERMRAAFADDKLGPFDDLIALLLGEGAHDPDRVRRAFELTERARARALVDRLVSEPPAHGATADQPTLTQQRALHARLAAAYSAMFAGETADADTVARNEAQVIALEQALSRLQLQMPPEAALGAGAPMSLEEIRAALAADYDRGLRDDTTLLSYYVLDERIIAFVVLPEATSDVLAVTTGQISTVRAALEQLDMQCERVANDPVLAQRHAGALERSTRSALARLYEALVEPVEAACPAVRRSRWVIVPHGLLHQVPFHALHDGTGYLIERCEMTYAPSATVMALCATRRPGPEKQCATIIGVSDAHIPYADEEARTVAASVLDAEVTLLTGGDATIEAFVRASSRSRLIHLACHGLFRTGNPMFSSLRLHDGWFMSADAMRLDLRGATVVLSACESGRSTAARGDEILGMARGFLSAGAPTLVVSLWLAHDRATTELMTGWYTRLQRGESASTALRHAQLDVKARYPHPFFWAPFILIGRG